jgi:hypothetical protein
MYSEMDDICWTCEVKDYFQTTEEEITEEWQVVEDDPEWEVISKEKPRKMMPSIQRFELSPNDTNKLLTREPLLIV